MLKSLQNAVDKVNTDLTGVDGVAEIIGVSAMYTRRLLPDAPVESVTVHNRTFYVIADVEKWAETREKDAEAKARAKAERDAKKGTGTKREGPTLKELRATAKEMGLKGYHHMPKADLIKAIEAGPPTEEKPKKSKGKAKSEPKASTLAELRKTAKALAAEIGVPAPKGNKAKIEAWIAKAEAGEIEPEKDEGGEDEQELTLEDMLTS